MYLGISKLWIVIDNIFISRKGSLSFKVSQLTRCIAAVSLEKQSDKTWPRVLKDKEQQDMIKTIAFRVDLQAKHVQHARRRPKLPAWVARVFGDEAPPGNAERDKDQEDQEQEEEGRLGQKSGDPPETRT